MANNLLWRTASAPARGPRSLLARVRTADPRIYQICALASLLVYGCLWLGFEVPLVRVIVILSTALAAQFVFSHRLAAPAVQSVKILQLCGDSPGSAMQRVSSSPFLLRQPPDVSPFRLRRSRAEGLARFDPRSPLISALSLCLLLRSDSLLLCAAAAFVTIAAKFLIRFNGKHLFNPTNFGLVAMMAITGGAVWVSPGQWGSVAFFAFLMACIGGMVVHRAARADVTIAFLAAYAGLLFYRSMWLGEPLAIPLHRLQGGGLLLFAFFMISDPKTTPDSRLGRLLFAALVAWGGWYIQFRLFRTNGLLWSLAGFSIAVPLIDFLLPGHRYSWAERCLPSSPPPPVPPPSTPALTPALSPLTVPQR